MLFLNILTIAHATVCFFVCNLLLAFCVPTFFMFIIFAQFLAHFHVNVAIYDACCQIYASATNNNVDDIRQRVLPQDKKWGVFGVNFKHGKLQNIKKEHKIDISSVQGRCSDLKGLGKAKTTTKIKSKNKSKVKQQKSKKKTPKTKTTTKSNTKKKTTTNAITSQTTHFEDIELPTPLTPFEFGQQSNNSFLEPFQTISTTTDFNVTNYDPKTGQLLGQAILPYHCVTADRTKETLKLVIVAPHIQFQNLVPNDIESTVQFYFTTHLMPRADQVKRMFYFYFV